MVRPRYTNIKYLPWSDPVTGITVTGIKSLDEQFDTLLDDGFLIHVFNGLHLIFSLRQYFLERENYFQGLIDTAHIVLFQFAPHPRQSQAIVNRSGLQRVGDGLLVKPIYCRR